MPFDEEILFDMTRIIDIETEIYDIMVEKLPFFEIEKKLDTVEYKQTMRRLELLKSKEQTAFSVPNLIKLLSLLVLKLSYFGHGYGILFTRKRNL